MEVSGAVRPIYGSLGVKQLILQGLLYQMAALHLYNFILVFLYWCTCFVRFASQMTKKSPSDSQEIPHILWNKDVHYRINKRPPPVHILSQINPIHDSSSEILKIYFNNILPPTVRPSKWCVFHRSTH